MATINTSTAFVTGTAMQAATWNEKYDSLYNVINGTLDNYNIATTAGILESKVQFSGSGHDHSSGAPINIAASINTSGLAKGGIMYFDGTTWASFATGAESSELKIDFDSYTKLVLHLDNASTDACSTPKTITNNNVTYSDTIFKFGGYAGVWNGTNAYLTTADSADWDFGSGTFTIDFWFKNGATGAHQIICGQGDSAATSGTIQNYIYLYDDNKIYANLYYTGASVSLASTSTFNGNLWTHVAVVRSGNVFTLYINGVAEDSETANQTLTNVAQNFSIGRLGDYNGQYFNGYIDEFRISKGIARWTANFTPPTEAYTTSFGWL